MGWWWDTNRRSVLSSKNCFAMRRVRRDKLAGLAFSLHTQTQVARESRLGVIGSSDMTSVTEVVAAVRRKGKEDGGVEEKW